MEKILNIKGMNCMSCAGKIERAIREVDGVISVEVDMGTKTAKINFDEQKVSIEALSKKIESVGYQTF